MSDETRQRAPLNEAGGRRGAPARRPFGLREQKLAYPDREGYHRHWFNDEPGRIARAVDAGYAQVKDDSGKPVSMTVGVARGGGAQVAYLMEIPAEWYRQDMAAQESGHRDLMNQIREGRVPGGPTGADRQAQYVPRDVGISIREERR
ncbi:hypothetical protein ACLRDC_10635 [Gluconacetobacter sacchari]|uniref:Uncharacterized protein n=2 Tax=Gluconacetobacter sacchari TaxID=92759 RepID=A0A7W4IAK4_9PROT|nr:hypothetical protein [Gluconacetobacter sacchari]MBB2159259.1 hypothetical protein [Gluconacetobacter sacchari]GBQ26812.1 hypothetical protein AA12717_2479 [Gluconacetobacter sacchari DSM 12717]